MPEYLSPGVYVEEVERGPKPIEGVSTSTAGFLGPTERGPADPQLVTSFTDFERTFGGLVESSNLLFAVDGFFRNGGSRCYVGRVTAADPDEVATATLSDADGNPVVNATAVGPGNWGEHVAVVIDDATLYKEGKNQLFKATIRYWSGDPGDVDGPGGDNPDPAPDAEEVYDNLSPDERSTDYDETQITGASHLIDVQRVGEGRPETGTTWLDGENGESGTNSENFDGTDSDDGPSIPGDEELEEMDRNELRRLAKPIDDVDGNLGEEELRDALREVRDGDEPRSDGGVETPTLGDYQGVDTPGERTGLAAFEEIDDISIVCVPDEHAVDGLTSEVVTHCENMGDRFAVLQTPQTIGNVADLEPPVDSAYAAFYFPWIEVMNPETSVPTLVPPGGHAAGIYARTDAQKGVHAAPANEVVRGAHALQLDVTKAEQDVLNPKGVNCIRSFRGRGIRVWGARTTSSDPLWKYVNVRRLLLYLEESIDEGTQWAVFEPNNEELWSRIRQTIRNFLTSAWEDNALMGTTPDEAFYVKCDRTTMSQDDIDNGRLICEIGIAPVKPAEFVVFRISQWTENAET